MQSTLFETAGHDPGGKVSLPLPAGMRGSAVFGGANDEYRYELTRLWDVSLPAMMLVMMNPSTADVNYNDPTVAKGCRYAQAWGYGRLLVGNVFAYRSTSPEGLMQVEDPVGPENDWRLLGMASRAHLIVFAYGQPHRSLRDRGPKVAAAFREAGHDLHVLRLAKNGVPWHPLYLPGDAKPLRWEPVSHSRQQ